MSRLLDTLKKMKEGLLFQGLFGAVEFGTGFEFIIPMVFLSSLLLFPNWIWVGNKGVLQAFCGGSSGFGFLDIFFGGSGVWYCLYCEFLWWS